MALGCLGEVQPLDKDLAVHAPRLGLEERQDRATMDRWTSAELVTLGRVREMDAMLCDEVRGT